MSLSARAFMPVLYEGNLPMTHREDDHNNVLPVFDKAVLMNHLMDDEELALTVIEGFLKDIPLQIEALKGFLEDGDASGAQRQAHTIKGASASVGGETLREVAFDLDQAGKAGDLKTVKASMPQLEMEFERLNRAMEKELSGK